MTAKTWAHKGHEITITDHGTFVATVAGKRLTGGSLDTLKKKIDQADTFEPFDCYFDESGWSTPTMDQGAVAYFEGEEVGTHGLWKGRAIGLETDKFRRHSSPQFRVEYVDKDGKACVTLESAVLPATDDARDTWLAMWEANDAAKIAEKALAEANKVKTGNLHAAVPWKRPVTS